MKSSIRTNILLILFFVFSLGSWELKAQSNNNNFKGLGFLELEYEKESGFNDDYIAKQLLDSIITECKSKIIKRDIYTYDQAVETLNTIGEVITRFNIGYDTLKLFSQALENKKLDCKFFTLTYLTVGENLSLPLFSMLAPKHVFLYWKDDKNEIYWEASRHVESSKQYYIDSLKIVPEAISSLCYLHCMDYNQSKNIIYYANACAKLILRGDYNGALADFNQSIKINPKFAEGYYNIGYIKSIMGQDSDALNYFNIAIELNPKYIDALTSRGNSKYILGDKQGAIADFTPVIEIDNKNYMAFSNRGMAKFDLGDYKGALEDFNKSIEIYPNESISYSNRGIAKFSLGDIKGAIVDYDQAIKLNPKNAQAYANRGNAKYELGDITSGCTDWKEAVNLGLSEINDWMKKANCK